MAAVVDGVPVAVPPPEGYVVDFENPPRNADVASYVISAIGMTLAALFVFQRLYVKHFVRNKLGYDDVLLVIAWLGSIAIQALIIRSFALKYLGVHAWEMPFERFGDFVKFSTYINNVVYAVPTCLCKVVILLFLLELNSTQRWYRWSIYFGIFAVVGSSLGLFFASLLPCQPFRKNWDFMFPQDEGHCIDRVALYYAIAIVGVLTDVVIIAIPIPMVWNLQLSMKKKAGLFGLFSIGSATVVTSAVRLGLLVASLTETDQTWGGGPVTMWICIEANLLVMCACLSTLRHFFKVVSPGLFGSSRNGGTATSSFGTSKAYGARSQHRHELQTIGGMSTRGGYNQFDTPGGANSPSPTGVDHAYPVMQTQINGGLTPGGGLGAGAHGRGHYGSSDDDSSEKGIVQKTETHVYYSPAPPRK